MSKTLALIIFLCVSILVISSIHYYLWIKMVSDTGLSSTFKYFGTLCLVVLCLSIPAAEIAYRMLPLKFSYPVLWGAYFWLGIMMLFFFAFLFTDVVHLLVFIYSKLPGTEESIANPDRREFIFRIVVCGVSALVLGLSFIGVKNYYTDAVVTKINISLDGLPEIFKGFKIVQISDLHIGQMMTGKALSRIVNRVNELKPDMIAITGDIADGPLENLIDEISPLKNLKAKKGVYFVTGNHEYYNGVKKWTRAIAESGIKVLNNENIEIRAGGDSFYLAGVTDYRAKTFGSKFASDCKKALAGINNGSKKILLAHQPVTAIKASEYGADLVLAGHTHGGQIWPFTYLVDLHQPFLKGVYKLNNTKIYVNQGTGGWGPPMRLGTFNEITEIILS